MNAEAPAAGTRMWRMTVNRRIVQSQTVEVQAATLEEAKTKAVDQADLVDHWDDDWMDAVYGVVEETDGIKIAVTNDGDDDED